MDLFPKGNKLGERFGMRSWWEPEPRAGITLDLPANSTKLIAILLFQNISQFDLR